MRKHTAKILIALAVLAGVGIALFLLRGREPIYQGKTAAAWFRTLYVSRLASKRITTLTMPTGPLLVEIPGDPDPEALKALRALGSNAVSHLVATIQYPDSFFERAYWRALAKVPSPLQWLFPRPVPKLALAIEAASTLPELGPVGRSAIPALVACLKTGNPLLDRPVREALGRMRPRFDELAPYLEDLAKQGHYATVCSLIRDLHFRGPETVGLLCQAGQAPNHGVDRTVLMLLEQQGPGAAPAVPILVTALGDPDSEVRYLSARTLGEIGTNARPALDALKRACHDANVMVRNAASKAIRKIAPDEDHPASSDGPR
jgi:hypothetical protein